jgi:hypothetical protein
MALESFARQSLPRHAEPFPICSPGGTRICRHSETAPSPRAVSDCKGLSVSVCLCHACAKPTLLGASSSVIDCCVSLRPEGGCALCVGCACLWECVGIWPACESSRTSSVSLVCMCQLLAAAGERVRESPTVHRRHETRSYC